MERYGTDKPDLRVSGWNWWIFGGGKEQFLQSVCRHRGARRQSESDQCEGRAGWSRKEISRWEEEAKSLGAKGLAWIAHRDEGLKGPVAKFFSDAEWAKIRELTSCGDREICCCSWPTAPLVEEVLGELRLRLAGNWA